MSGTSIKDDEAAFIALDLVKVISDNAAYLSKVDGAIGDGDHGINMRKGFDLFGEMAKQKGVSAASEGFILLGNTLMNEIGGSMGPLYGSMFKAMGRTCRDRGAIDAQVFLDMLKAGAESVMRIGEAHRGDKTLLDVILPAIDEYEAALKAGKNFQDALVVLSGAAEKAAAATKDMVAKIGRAARLGERSRGVQDAGATSCSLLIRSIADGLIRGLA
jgi:dihydroxyacetone kinase-like protein